MTDLRLVAIGLSLLSAILLWFGLTVLLAKFFLRFLSPLHKWIGGLLAALSPYFAGYIAVNIVRFVLVKIGLV